MTALFIDSALRTLALALAAWAGLRIFRIRNVLAEKAAWTVVLAAALLMPLLLPVAARWPAATLVLPAIASHPAARVEESAPAAAFTPADAQPAAAAIDQLSASGAADRFPAPSISQSDLGASPTQPEAPQAPQSRVNSLAEMALLLYLVVAAALLFRLLYGLAAAFGIWRAAEPIPSSEAAWAEELHLRCSRSVFSPVTIGSAVVLPADYADWDEEKLRIVLAHERSHIRQGDFYLQMLAGMYAALVWFSPLGWWLRARLSDLGEAISDRSGLEAAASHSSYAQVLLEFAAAPRPTLIGVAMARSSSLARRIERLLNPSAFRQSFAGGRRAFLAAVLVPAALFAVTTLVRVQAATQAPQASAQTQKPITGQAHPDAAEPTVTPNAVQLPPQQEPAPAPQPSAAPPARPAPLAKPAQHIEVPPIHVHVPAIHVNVPEEHIDVPGVHVDIPAQHIDVPATHVDVPAIHVNVPAQHIEIPAIHIDVPASGAEKTSGYQYSYGSNGQLMAMLSGMEKVFEPAGFHAALIQPVRTGGTEATFDRTLQFSGKLDLRVINAAGDIHIRRGPANQVVIHAQVHSQYASDADAVRAIAAKPPIEQNGSMVRVGGGQYMQGVNHISIDYEIEAPADAGLEAMSASGNIVDEGVGQGAKLETGSGNITATGLQGGFKTESGSGNIAVENTGQGDAKAETGSGDIVVHGVNGALKAETGSGNIQVAGTPSAAWKLETGSGNVDFSPGSAPLTLDASTGGGTISSDRAMASAVSSDRHRLHAELNGGGPAVRIETGSGHIEIH